MASRVPSSLAPREKVTGPPVGWRPRALTLKEKLQVIVNQSGRDPTGPKLDPMGEGIEFDHSPAIQQRRWDPVAQDTAPASCDLLYIVARNKKAHRAKTAKGDVPMIAKTRRLETQAERRAAKKKFPWPSRPMGKRKKP